MPLAFLTALILIQSTVGQTPSNTCPMNCFCENKMVECMSLMDFPVNLPLDTKVIKMSQMNVRDIPPNAFSYLPDLESIEFNNCNIQSLQGCSFAGMPSIKKIYLVKTVIENIQRYAFRDLWSITVIQLDSCRIGRIKPFGFYNLHEISQFTIVDTHIQNFYNFALYNVTNIERWIVTRSNFSDIVTGAFDQISDIRNTEIHMNKFWNMQCLVLEDIMKASRNTIFLQNTFYCNCSVYGLINTAGRAKFPGVIEKNRCHGPERFENRSTLWHVSATELTCPGLDMNREPACTKVPLVPNPKCPTLIDGVFESVVDDDNDDDDSNFGSIVQSNIVMIALGLFTWTVLICK